MLSCGLCTTACRDTLPSCADRADECRTNSTSMARSCPVTCDICSSMSEPPASAGECDAAAALPPGWFRLRSGHFRHQFYADAPPGASVDVNRSLSRAGVEWRLPPGWRWRPGEPAAPFANVYFGEASASWPVTFQNEERFGPYYRRLSRRVAADARAIVARRGASNGRDALAPAVRSGERERGGESMRILETALRILRGSELLRDSGEFSVAQVAEAAAASADAVRAYAGAGRARLLFLVGHPWDWYHHHAAYRLPAWLIRGATALLPRAHRSEPCGTWGWERRPLVNLPAAAVAASGDSERDGDSAAAATATATAAEARDAGHARVAADVAIAAFVHQHWSGAIEVEAVDVCADPERALDPRFLDRFDVIHAGMFGSYDMATAASNADRARTWATGRVAVRTGVASALGNALRATTRAVVWPPPPVDFNANKSRLPLLLRAAGVPAAPAFDVALEASPASSGKPGSKESKEAWAAAAEADGRVAEQVVARAAAAGWEAAFVKPHGSSFMNGVDRLEVDEATVAGGAAAVREATGRLRSLISSLRRRGAPGLVAMRHLPSVATSWEMRIFFAGGESVWAIGNKVDAVQFTHTERRDDDYYFSWDWLDRDGGGINASAVRFDEVLVPLARTALEAASAEGVREAVLAPATSHVAGEWQPPVARVDVACCLAADDELAATAEGWFVNEIEWAPDSMMAHFLHHLATTIEQPPRWQDDERLRSMVSRAAAAWYPTSERMATELARFALETAERSRGAVRAAPSGLEVEI